MKQMSILVVLGLLLGSMLPAHAQFAGPHPNRNDDTTSEKPEKFYRSVSVYPVAFFDTGGILGNVSGTQTLGGGLVNLDFGKLEKGGRARYEVGGWYWGRDDFDIYELHLRAVSANGLGIQLGYLNTTKGFIIRPGVTNQVSTRFSAFDLFALYELSSNRNSDSKYKSWSLQFGLGAFIDESTHFIGPSLQQQSTNPTVNLTFFVSAQLMLTPRISLNASDWLIRDGGVDLNRVAVGLGYKF